MQGRSYRRQHVQYRQKYNQKKDASNVTRTMMGIINHTRLHPRKRGGQRPRSNSNQNLMIHQVTLVHKTAPCLRWALISTDNFSSHAPVEVKWPPSAKLCISTGGWHKEPSVQKSIYTGGSFKKTANGNTLISLAVL
jgi:hypothetical protein